MTKARDGLAKLSAAAVLALVVAGGLTLAPPRSAALLKVGFLVVTHGQVRLKHPDEDKFKTIVEGKREWLLCNDILQTLSKGTADLTIEPNTRLTVLPDTVFTIKCKEGENQIQIEVLRGSVQGQVGQGKDMITTIVNPTTTLSTKGATFLNRVVNANHSFVQVFQGQVTITHVNGSVITVNEKQAIEIVTGSKPDMFTVRVTEGQPGQHAKVEVIPGVQVLVEPNDAVGIEKRLSSRERVEIRLVAPADNKGDVVVVAGELKRSLAPADSALLTFRQQQIFVISVEPDFDGPPTDFSDPFGDPEDFRDITDLGFTDDELIRLLAGPPPGPPPASPTK